jgi:outer membrane protein TolC
MLSGRVTLGLAVTILVVSCATPPRWTPQTVAPPETPPASIEQPAPLEKRVEPVSPSAAPEAGQPVKLTRDGALLTAIMNNRTIEVARLGPPIGETFVREARAAFDPVVLGSVAVTHVESRQLLGSTSSASATTAIQPQTPIQTSLTQLEQAIAALEGPQKQLLKTDATSGSVAIQEIFPTGTRLSISQSAASIDTNLLGDTSQNGWVVSVDQPLLRGAGLAVNLVTLRQAKNTAAQSQYALKNTVLGIAEQVELGYWNLVLGTEVVKIREFAVKLADEQLKLNEERLNVGKAIEGDVMASQAEKATRQADLVDAQAAVRRQTVALIQLLNPDGAEPWKITFEPADKPLVAQRPVDPGVSEQLALEYRPELAQAKLNLANLDLAIAQAKNGLLPQLDVVSSFGTSGAIGGTTGASSSLSTSTIGDDAFNYQIGLQVTTPILYRAERARYRRAMLFQKQGERSLADLEQTVASQVRQAVVEVERQWERIGATGVAVQSRTEQLRVAQGRFDVGKVSNLDLLLVQRDFIQSQVDDATARVNYTQGLISLYASEGTLLERRGVSLETAGDSDS